MSHDFHEDQPGYHPDQVVFDGCWQCGGQSLEETISYLSDEDFAAAWDRAQARALRGLPNASEAEVPLLDALWAVRVKLQGLGVPVDHLAATPVTALHAASAA